MSATKLRSRWSGEEFNFLCDLFPAATKNQQMRDFPGGEVVALVGLLDGRIDLRGFPLHQFVSFRAANLDFSLARSPKNEFGVDRLIFLYSCILTNCLFNKAAVFQHCGGTLKQCDFSAARFNNCGLAGQFTECVFDSANMSRSIISSSTFENCSFRGVNFRGAGISGSTFTRCTFADCNFQKSGYTGVDLNTMPTESMTVIIPVVGEPRYEDVG